LPQRGSAALVERRGDSLVVVAVGTGRFLPETEPERALSAAMKRSRAVRAAVVSAKAALAEQVSSEVSVTTLADIRDQNAGSFSSSVMTKVRRTILAQAWPWKINAEPDGEGFSARVWLYFPKSPTAVSTGHELEGLPAFDRAESAAETIAQWAERGLCEGSPIRVFVGKPGSERLMVFGVGLADSGPSGEAIARSKSLANLARGSSLVTEQVDAAKTIKRSQDVDPLSPDGNQILLREEFFHSKRYAQRGTVRPTSAPISRLLSNGLFCVVAWSTVGE
jgi:hypothetical protein